MTRLRTIEKHSIITYSALVLILIMTALVLVGCGTAEEEETKLSSDDIYKDVKQDYIEQVESLVNGTADYDNIDFMAEYFEVNYPSMDDLKGDTGCGFAYEDIDGNGTEELLVFANGSLGAIWTNDGEKAVRLLGRRDNTFVSEFIITEDGKIFETVLYGNGLVEGKNIDYYLHEFNKSGTALNIVEHYEYYIDNFDTFDSYYLDKNGNKVNEAVIEKYYGVSEGDFVRGESSENSRFSIEPMFE